MSRYTDWTLEELNHVNRVRLLGLTWEDVARELGNELTGLKCLKAAQRYRMSCLKPEEYPDSTQRDKRIIERLGQGMTDKEVADLFDITPTTVARIRKRYDVKTLKERRVAEIRELRIKLEEKQKEVSAT